MDEAFQASQSIATAFLKCTKWIVEEANDLADCPYHSFCGSTYPGNYPAIIDLLVVLFAVLSYLSATIFTILSFRSSSTPGADTKCSIRRRYLVPSGPIALPIALLVLAKGQRISTIFPLSLMAPALLHLLQVSALAFENPADRSLRYAVLEASTVSGILHASLYVDSIILPYYTGLEALTNSKFSGDCATCVCTREALVAGGRSVSYRGWSRTALAVVFALCSRMLSRILGGERFALFIRMAMEGVSWVLIVIDCVHLTTVVPRENVLLSLAAYGGLLVLIFLNVLRRMSPLAQSLPNRRFRKKINLCNDIHEIP